MFDGDELGHGYDQLVPAQPVLRLDDPDGVLAHCEGLVKMSVLSESFVPAVGSNSTAAVVQVSQDNVIAILETQGNTKKGLEKSAKTGCSVATARVRREW